MIASAAAISAVFGCPPMGCILMSRRNRFIIYSSILGTRNSRAAARGLPGTFDKGDLAIVDLNGDSVAIVGEYWVAARTGRMETPVHLDSTQLPLEAHGKPYT